MFARNRRIEEQFPAHTWKRYETLHHALFTRRLNIAHKAHPRSNEVALNASSGYVLIYQIDQLGAGRKRLLHSFDYAATEFALVRRYHLPACRSDILTGAKETFFCKRQAQRRVTFAHKAQEATSPSRQVASYE